MNRVAVIYFSRTGNTEAMAEAIVSGAIDDGNGAALIPVEEADPEYIASEYSILALGCPAWGRETIDDTVMIPFLKKLSPGLIGKKVVVFGSCGWSKGKWLMDWEKMLEGEGAEIIHPFFLSYGYPDEEGMKAAEKLGHFLSSL